MDTINKKALIAASGLVLATYLPDNFDKLSESELDEYLKTYANEIYNDLTADQIWDLITEIAELALTFDRTQAN